MTELETYKPDSAPLSGSIFCKQDGRHDILSSSICQRIKPQIDKIEMLKGQISQLKLEIEAMRKKHAHKDCMTEILDSIKMMQAQTLK